MPADPEGDNENLFKAIELSSGGGSDVSDAFMHLSYPIFDASTSRPLRLYLCISFANPLSTSSDEFFYLRCALFSAWRSMSYLASFCSAFADCLWLLISRSSAVALLKTDLISALCLRVFVLLVLLASTPHSDLPPIRVSSTYLVSAHPFAPASDRPFLFSNHQTYVEHISHLQILYADDPSYLIRYFFGRPHTRSFVRH